MNEYTESNSGQMSFHGNQKTEISNGDLLEYRLKRLLFHMGYYVQNNILLKTSPNNPCDVITDLDVYGMIFHNDFSFETIWADCKSGKADILKHISWINGIKMSTHISSVIFIKKGVRKTAKEYAQSLGIKVFDLEMISKLEKRFGVNESDWSGCYNYKVLQNLPRVFTRIAIPDNKHYKNIFEFYNSAYWSLDAFSQVRKCISGLKQLLEYYNLPLDPEQKTSIKWMMLSFIDIFVLATIKICGQAFYYEDNDKKAFLLNGLMSSSISIEKQNEIRSISIKMASDIIKQKLPDFDSTMLNKISSVTPPYYFEAYYDLTLRILDAPLIWRDIPRLFQHALIESELEHKDPNANVILNNPKFSGCLKTILFFISDITGIPKETFYLLAN